MVRHSGVGSELRFFLKIGLICVGKIAESDYQLRHVCPSALNNSAPTGRIYIKIDILIFFKNMSTKLKFH